MSATIEQLETRNLLSVSVTEAEANNTTAKANPIPHTLDAHVLVSGKVKAPGDHDWFKLQLNAGDVVGGALAGQGGLDTILHLFNNAGKLMIGNDDCFLDGQRVHPTESPLPYNTDNIRDSEVYYVIKNSGTYFLEVSAFEDATAGDYTLDLLVTRPGLERAPLGTKQTLFLDFDGAKVGFLNGTAVGPIADALPSWGLTAADEGAVIDRIVRHVTDHLFTYVAAHGVNRNIGLEVRNSRDHADEYGSNPYVSRVAVGLLKGKAFGTDGIAQYIDVGNFNTHDEAVVTVDSIAPALQVVGIRPPLTVVDGVAVAVGNLICHEMGHILGCYHTDQPSFFEGAANLMDPDGTQVLGPDFILGTKDDMPREFGADAYNRNELFEGVNDTLNNVAFALSVGKGGAAAAGAFSATRVTTSAAPAIVSVVDRELDGEDLAIL